MSSRFSSPASPYFIGLMSGTSLDGVDGVVLCWDEQRLRIEAHVAWPFEPDFQQDLLALQNPGPNELHRAALAANRLARVYAGVVQALLNQTGLESRQIRAIGAHGQTVRHQPGRFDTTGYTWQINNPALLAELSGIDVVADFRARDVAAGGQGAPLVPAFHARWFARPGQTVAVLNVGGMSNLSVLRWRDAAKTAPQVQGFDCGPGNVLMDAWCQRHTSRPYDDLGAWAATGRVQEDFLQDCLDEPYFSMSPPKSTGRDLFDAAWLTQKLQRHPGLAPEDVQSSLLALSVQCVAQEVQSRAADSTQLLVCGGGAFNVQLMRALQQALPQMSVVTSAQAGLPPLQVEAAAFAWLAHQHLERLSGNCPEVTGAAGGRVLGAFYPA